jgi:hypothetical protein
MSESPQAIYPARHGETAWKLSGQHTGLSDLPLAEGDARRRSERLDGYEQMSQPVIRFWDDTRHAIY